MKLVAFIFTSLPLKTIERLHYIVLLLSDVFVVSDLSKTIDGSTDLGNKRHGTADLHAPPRLSATSCCYQ